jgi:hypothetical protein
MGAQHRDEDGGRRNEKHAVTNDALKTGSSFLSSASSLSNVGGEVEQPAVSWDRMLRQIPAVGNFPDALPGLPADEEHESPAALRCVRARAYRRRVRPASVYTTPQPALTPDVRAGRRPVLERNDLLSALLPAAPSLVTVALVLILIAVTHLR